MARIGYARISTRSQSDDSQVDELNAAGCTKIFADKGVSGKLASRPQWDACLEYLRPGDVLVITRLSRAMRSLKELLSVAEGLKTRDIGLKVLKQPIDTTTPEGMLVFSILGAVDAFTRDLIVEGTNEGLAAARARGRKGGRRPVLSEAQQAEAVRLYDSVGPDGKRVFTVADIAAKLRCSRPTIYAAVDRQRALDRPERAVQ
jgi:DNA invertase Pin-like site-specific DNA recombinase